MVNQLIKHQLTIWVMVLVKKLSYNKLLRAKIKSLCMERTYVYVKVILHLADAFVQVYIIIIYY